ncbi:MAG: AraC family transcriptional regulator, partial [Lachnospiraceae bacterium]|nr:AraC family transcriptional regulator [Lachnospiraceae bacterium]
MKSSMTNREYPVQVICATHNDPELSFGCSCCHEEVEILFVHSGQILLKTEDTSVILKSGQGILINRNIPHTVFPAKQGTFSLYCLIFDPYFLFDNRQPDLADKYLAPILDNPDIRTLLLTESSDSSCGLLSAVRDIIACNLSGAFGRELYTKGRLCLFWHHLLSHFLSPSETVGAWRVPCATADGIRIRQAIRFIEQNYTESITLDDIAFSIHVSRSECCRCFK